MYGVTEIDAIDTLIAGPTIEPVDLDEAKKALRFGSTTEDTLFDTWISGARQDFESQTGRQLLSATWEYWLNGSPCQCRIELPHPPLQSVVSITYDDENGDAQTFDAANYIVVNPQGPHCRRGYVELVNGASWPIVGNHAKALRIRFIAGYGDAPGAVPEVVKGALYLLIGLRHKFRTEVHEGRSTIPTQLPLGAESIMKQFKDSAIAQLPALTRWCYGYAYQSGSYPWF